MNGHEFISSNKKLARHLVFWGLWWCYFYGCRYFYPKLLLTSEEASSQIRTDNIMQVIRPYYEYWVPSSIWGTTEFIRSLFMLSIHIVACYIIIYFLLPWFLLKARYLLFLSGILMIGFLMIFASRLVDTVIMPTVVENGSMAKTPFYASVFAGVINAIKIIAVAVAIKLAKHWWSKQKEKERIEKDKIEAELRLLKAQIHPKFLFGALNDIYSFALTASPKAAQMLLKLSDILSYNLYECNDAEVLLSKEIKMLKDYMALQDLQYAGKLEMNIQVTGDTSKYKIVPQILLRFIENSFGQSRNNSIDQAWINLELRIENHVLEMKLINGKALENQESGSREENDLQLAEKLLLILYPGKYTLKITEEPEIMIVKLQLQLTPLTGEIESFENPTTSAGSLRFTNVFSEPDIAF